MPAPARSTPPTISEPDLSLPTSTPPGGRQMPSSPADLPQGKQMEGYVPGTASVSLKRTKGLVNLDI